MLPSEATLVPKTQALWHHGLVPACLLGGHGGNRAPACAGEGEGGQRGSFWPYICVALWTASQDLPQLGEWGQPSACLTFRGQLWARLSQGPPGL